MGIDQIVRHRNGHRIHVLGDNCLLVTDIAGNRREAKRHVLGVHSISSLGILPVTGDWFVE